MRHTEDEAINYFFWSLQRLAPHVLAALRDGPDDPASIAEWAVSHGLNTPRILERATETRRFWAEDREVARDAAAQLDFPAIITFGGRLRPKEEYGAEEQAWVDRKLDPRAAGRNLPDPVHESSEEWLARATEMYQERAAIICRDTPLPPPRKRTKFPRLDRHCKWFAMLYVLKMRPKEVALAVGVDVSAVSREADKVATLLGLPRFKRSPRGRHRARAH